MNILEIKKAIIRQSFSAQEVRDIVGLLALPFPEKEPISDALIDAVLVIEKHIREAEAAPA